MQLICIIWPLSASFRTTPGKNLLVVSAVVFGGNPMATDRVHISAYFLHIQLVSCALAARIAPELRYAVQCSPAFFQGALKHRFPPCDGSSTVSILDARELLIDLRELLRAANSAVL